MFRAVAAAPLISIFRVCIGIPPSCPPESAAAAAMAAGESPGANAIPGMGAGFRSMLSLACEGGDRTTGEKAGKIDVSKRRMIFSKRYS